MTPTEVLEAIRKMPLSERRRLRDELDDDLSKGESNGDAKEPEFIESMRKKGLITTLPNRLKGGISRNAFKRVNVIGKPISQTIIEDRG